MIEKTEKRAYAVVRESPDGLLYLNFEGWQESVALFRSGLKKDERVEIRLRVAQGEAREDVNPYGVDDADRCTQIHLGRRCCYPKEHTGNCALEFASAPEEPRCVALVWDAALVNREPCDKPLPCSHHPAAGQEVPSARNDLVGSSDEKTGPVDASATESLHERRLCKPGDAGLVARPTAQSEEPSCKPQGPQALPEEVVCDADARPHRKDECGVYANPRPAHPPAARTEQEKQPREKEVKARELAVVCDTGGTYYHLGAHLRVPGCINPHDVAPVSAAPVDPAPHAPSATPEPEPMVFCAWVDGHGGRPHEQNENCIDPEPAKPKAPTPEPEKLGEGPMAKAERRGCKIGGEP